MKKETFEKIMTHLNKHLQACKDHLEHIKTTDDLSNISVKEFVELKSFAKAEIGDMTEICMVDLYHVIGMGELTVTQMNSFIKAFKEYTSYRSDLKALSVMTGVDNLPKLPSRSSYKLHKLGDIVLTSKLRGRVVENIEPVEDTEEVSDYQKSKDDVKAMIIDYNGIHMQGNIVTMGTGDVRTFLDIVNKSAKEETVLKSALSSSAYLSIVWEYTDEEHSTLRGIVIDNSVRDSIRDKLKNKGLIK